jgi:hypothetical protein
MSLKLCKDCGKEISRAANVCPQCGKPQGLSCGMIFLIIFIIIPIVGIAIISGINSFNSKKKDNFNYNTYELRMKATLFSQNYIKNISKDHPKIKITFDKIDGATATFNKNSKEYLVDSYFTIQSVNGEKSKNHYFMLVSYNPKYKYWMKINMKTIPVK